MWRIHITTIAIKTQQTFPLYCCWPNVVVNHVKLFSGDMGMKAYVPLWTAVALQNISYWCQHETYLGLYANCLMVWSYFNKISIISWFSWCPPTIKFHEIPSSWSRANMLGEMERRFQRLMWTGLKTNAGKLQLQKAMDVRNMEKQQKSYPFST